MRLLKALLVGITLVTATTLFFAVLPFLIYIASVAVVSTFAYAAMGETEKKGEEA